MALHRYITHNGLNSKKLWSLHIPKRGLMVCLCWALHAWLILMSLSEPKASEITKIIFSDIKQLFFFFTCGIVLPARSDFISVCKIH